MEPEFNAIVGTARPSRSNGRAGARPPDAVEPTSPDVEGAISRSPKRAWAEADGIFWGTPSSHERLPGGLYRLDMRPNIGETFIRQKNDTDALVQLPDSAGDQIVSEIQEFKKLKPAFTRHGFLYKRGILMWGPPGSGKTCTLQMIVKLLLDEHDSIAVLIEHPVSAGMCLQALRRIEPERQIVAILEDIDALCDQYDERAYLALLDGESQVDNIVYIATTNYPERLDKRFVDRPSRFDTIRYIGMPTPEARATYLRAKIPGVSETRVQEYVALSNGFSIAHLREFIVLTCCFGLSLEAAAERLSVTKLNPPNSEKAPDKPDFGFGASA